MSFVQNRKDVAKNMQKDALALIVLNVGDGDSNIILFPEKYGPKRACAIIDCFNADKTIEALKDLSPKVIPFICATHPHADHIKGLKKVLQWCLIEGIEVEQFWDSGFRHVSKTHYDIIKLLAENPQIKVIYPTSGYETAINRVRIQVLSPSILLKNRYDTFGTNINNASIVLKFEYPPKDIAPYYLSSDEAFAKEIAEQERLFQYTLILGGDAQFDAWARITEEYPELKHTSNRGQMIDSKTLDHKPLRCQVLKVPHHMSKHGISLEVLETLLPRYTLASCSNNSEHAFPHELTVLAVEDLRKKDADKGLRFTGHPQSGLRSGTLVALFREGRKRPLIYGLGEKEGDKAPLPVIT